MADEKGVLLMGAEGHYFIPHSEIARFAVDGDADPDGTLASQAPPVQAFTVQRTTVEEEGGAVACSLAAEHDAARILAAAND